MDKADFLKTWSREAVNEPGIPVETVSLSKSPILLRPIMRKESVA